MLKPRLIIVVALISLLLVGVQSPAHKGLPVIGLALSGGAAWGIAHIAVIEVLEEAGVSFDIITGTSAGAIVGALYAGGVTTQELLVIASDLSWTDFLVPAIPDRGFFNPRGIKNFVLENLDVDDFSLLPIRFAAVATDLESGKEVIIDSGSISMAVAASAAIPIIFEPVNHEGRLLVDGGLVNNLPAELARQMGADIVIAVNLSKEFFEEGKPEGLIDIGIRAYNIMHANAVKLAGADLEIAPDLTGIRGVDLGEYQEILLRGRIAAEEALPEVVAVIARYLEENQ